MTAPFVVVGASLAGLRAIEAARTGGFNGPITLVGAEPHLPYDRPPLSKAFLTAGAEPTYFRAEQHLVEDLGVELRLGTPATALDPATKTITAGGDRLTYGTALIATGSTPITLPTAQGAHVLRTLDDARAIRKALEDGARTVVIGGGFIGSEVASSARCYGDRVTIVEAAPVPLIRAAGPVVGAALADLHRRQGTDVRLGVSVTSVTEDAVHLSDGSVLDADLVVVGIGSRPATGWLAGSGVALDPLDDGVLCDDHLATSVPDVYAAGDVAHWPNAAFDGTRMRMENWTAAAEQGAAAARNALGLGDRKAYRTVPYVWTDWYDSRIQFVGRPQGDDVHIALGDLDGPKFVALYRSGDRIVGAVTLNEPGKVMKYRRLIQNRADWDSALALFPAPAA